MTLPLPPPLTPADCDLRNFPFMPLDCVRLRDSDLASMEEPEACWAAVLLWTASWHQVPAGSLPDEDRVLSSLAGYGRVVKEWLRVRKGALRGFIKCADGRLYHPVVADKAREAWEGKLKQLWATECARIRKSNERHKTTFELPTLLEFKANRLWISDGTASTGQPSPIRQPAVSHETGAEVTRTDGPNPRDKASNGKGDGYLTPPSPSPLSDPTPTLATAQTASRPPVASPRLAASRDDGSMVPLKSVLTGASPRRGPPG